MSGAASLSDPGRVAAVRRLPLLDGPPRPVFDRLTALAADLIDVPIAMLTLIDADRQFFVSAVGLPEPLQSLRQTPLDFSLCQHAVTTARPLIVGDTRGHPDLATNRAVVEFGVAAYAGIPLITDESEALGTLCVLDTRPRDWTDDQLAILAQLADIITEELNRLVEHLR